MKLKVKKLTSFWQKTRGLMFAKEVTPVYFETRFGIHTFFLHFPIDVVILDKNFVVRKVKRNLKPWNFFLWNPKYSKVLELPTGFVYRRKIQVGMKAFLN